MSHDFGGSGRMTYAACRKRLRDAVRRHPGSARLLGELRVRRMLAASTAPELAICVDLTRPATMFVDVGANVGDFSLAASRRVGASGVVLALEPNPAAFRELRLSTARSRVVALDLAASDRNGWSTLSVPIGTGGRPMVARGSIALPAEASSERHRARTIRLDDLVGGTVPVSVIKIDVEGHELAVLRGAEETILRDRPALVVEIEARHLEDGDVSRVARWILDRGYEGFGLAPQRLLPWAEFDVVGHQTRWLDAAAPRGVTAGSAYINNFAFVPAAG